MHESKNPAKYRKPPNRGSKWHMGLGSALLRLGGVWIQSVGGVKRLIALYYGKIATLVMPGLAKLVLGFNMDKNTK